MPQLSRERTFQAYAQWFPAIAAFQDKPPPGLRVKSDRKVWPDGLSAPIRMHLTTLSISSNAENHNNGNNAQSTVVLHATQDFEAIEIRHQNIQNNQVESLLAQNLQCLYPIFRPGSYCTPAVSTPAAAADGLADHHRPPERVLLFQPLRLANLLFKISFPQ